MLKQRESALEKGSELLQVMITLACFILAWQFTHHFIKPLDANLKEYKVVFILIVPIWFILLGYFGLGRLARVKMYSAILLEYMSVVGIGIALLMACIMALDFNSISRLNLALFAGVNFIVLAVYKLVVYRIMKLFRGKGYNTRTVLIIADKDSYYLIDRLIETADWGYKIWAIMSDSDEIRSKYGHKYTVIPESSDMEDIIDGKSLDEVMYCKGVLIQEEIKKMIYTCAEVGVVFRMQSAFLSVLSLRSKLSYFNQIPFLTVQNTPGNYLALKIKSFIDYLTASLILLAISPVMLIIALLIKLGDGGPVFFAQKRVGQNGRRFPCLKFRTMVINAEALKASLMDQNEQEGPVFKIKKDPRVTKIGNFLRKTSLDELPQFLNVLRGEMSIVGPRPPVPQEVKEYERWQRRRLSMKPGITCIWQVSGRNNIPFDQWMKMDMQYIDSWSLKLDLILFIKTFKVMLTGDGQ
ncbi:sugar transferase [Ancylomarina sp. 16SWW S1-10-2]|uniref:sugar transferase n=1 Tax=Ancylomarina sp. 16SWW S1-10-2 TaxID=2499681 RepID=UPI0012AD3670|nr:sugar transferase [Ancylomarina sp. 16SWW S1-10-2]MRT91931.1 sugar transferase [Ancylomarina sp. 16SWW S1-10-2]